MSSIYNPYDWYWRAGDGRIFASVRNLEALHIVGDAGETDRGALMGGAEDHDQEHERHDHFADRARRHGVAAG